MSKYIASLPAFKQQYNQRITKKLRKKFKKKMSLFRKNPHDPQLKRHYLNHQWKDYESFNIDNDYRVIFTERKYKYILVAFGNHDQLYRAWKKPGSS